MNAPIVIKNVTPDHIATLLASVEADHSNRVIQTAGLPNDYEIIGHGLQAKVSYAPDVQLLTVNVISKPWIATMSEIRDKLVAALGSTPGA